MTSDPQHDAGQAGSLPHPVGDARQAGSLPHHLGDARQAGSLPHAVDRRLREAFEPDAEAAAGVAARASSGEVPRGCRRRLALRVAWAGAAVLAAALGAAVYWRTALRTVPEPAPVDLLSGSFTGDVLVLSEPDGSVSVSGPGTREDRPPEGFGIVLVEGDDK